MNKTPISSTRATSVRFRCYGTREKKLLILMGRSRDISGLILVTGGVTFHNSTQGLQLTIQEILFHT